MNKQIAQHLLDIGAVAVQPNEPFTLSSGLKSPIYCDNRLTISYPDVRRAIAAEFEKIVREKYPEVEVIAGAATGGIPHAAWVSENMNLPMVYVRGSAKGHGKQKQTEGVLREGQKVVVVEDLFSTGGSALKAVNGLRNEGAEVLGIVGIFTYGLKKADEAFREADVSWETITNLSTLLEVAELTEEERNKIKKWAADPASEAWLES
ncbi:MAG TPA: orotate phosphoribosyltransferase [Bacillales bacterium]|nr:orotate phosphoribosyltransferase [Bacillales bacterium]